MSHIGIEQLANAHWFMASPRVRTFLKSAAELTERGLRSSVDPSKTASDEIRGYQVLSGGVAVIDIVGVLLKYPSWFSTFLGATATEPIRQSLAIAVNDSAIRYICLRIDSPGGTVNGSYELAAAVAAANRIKPIVAIISDCAASAAYLIASQTRQISCNPAGMAGCIGAYHILTDDSKLSADLGISYQLVSTGGVKGLGADGKVTAELVADVQREVTGMGELFINAVATGRKMKVEQARKLADGRSWLAADAKSMGLIDVIAEAQEAIAMVSSTATTSTTYNSGAQPRKAKMPDPNIEAAAQKEWEETSISNKAAFNYDSAAFVAARMAAEEKWTAMAADERDKWLDKGTFIRFELVQARQKRRI